MRSEVILSIGARENDETIFVNAVAPDDRHERASASIPCILLSQDHRVLARWDPMKRPCLMHAQYERPFH
ncbi:hypothetical protein [Bradyrhizobium liaoningense]|uniref:hypothetical protein n=1 Tax=Bradyrhizobium liaoningense TaxID=43992 RepID=UPI001BAB9546|nr:hypothetical protein [Bradyrhizobium liaoningense]MBR0986661.1 hypothetical protein [Bradyrhizobium liaoningense]